MLSRIGSARGGGTAFCLLSIFVAGCGIQNIDRLNHLHSDENQKVAEGALDSFEKFASDQSGLAPTLLKNLRSQSAHNRGMNELRVAVDETDLTISLTGRTWNGLRISLYRDLGVMEGETGETVEDFTRWQRRLDVRTRTRYRKVQAVGAVLKALGLGQEYLIVQAKENVRRAVEELEKRQKAATQPTTRDSDAPAASAADDEQAQKDADRLVGILFDFRHAIIRAGNEAVKRETARTQALALQREILAAVEQSRDKAMAYALVAVIGTGLSQDSIARLNAFLDELASRLDGFSPPTTGAPEGAGRAWDRFVEAATEARELVAATRGLDDLGALRLERVVEPERIRAAVGHVHLAARRAGIATDADAAPAVAPAQTTQAAAEYAREMEARFVVRFSESTPEVLAEDLSDVGSEIARQIEEFRSLIDKLPPSLVGKDLSELLDKVKAAGTSKDALAKAGEEYLRKALASNPALHRQLAEIQKDPEAKKRFDARVEHLGQILSDIDKESAAATNRVLEFLRDLYRLQLDLHEENLRHYRALAGVSAAELKRWELLSYLNGRYRRTFPDVWSRLARLDTPVSERARELRERAGRLGGSAARRPQQLLQTQRQLLDERQEAFGLFLANARRVDAPEGQSPLPAHPVIEAGDPIVHSLRLLAETARAWQFASPTRDPRGANVRGSFHRLASGVELINGQLLMISINERFSLENGLTLRTEVQEHDLHLDAIAARTREAGLRLGLRDLVAYHSSGITNEDIQSVLGVIQQVLLASICSDI